MMERKPIAPKPVRKSSNILGVKVESSFEKSNQSSVNPFYPNTTKAKSINRFDEFGEIEEIEKNENFDIFLNLERVSLQNSQFENELETEISKENAKSEILSILKIDSTQDNYFRSSANLFSTNSNSTEDVSYSEYVRTSLPPMRSSNPFSKNFQSENSEDDFDLVKFNSAKLFNKNKLSKDK